MTHPRLASAPLWLMVALIPCTAYATDPLLRRTSGGWLYGPMAVWKDGDASSTELFHPMSEPIAAAGLISARVSYQPSEDSGACQLRAAVRLSGNGVDWDFQEPIYNTAPDWQNGNNVRFQTTYVDLGTLGTTARAFVQFWVETNNDAGITPIKRCNATIRVEPKERL